MGKKWEHFKTVCRHKAAVFRECSACGIPVQGLLHDLSKFSPAEFGPSANYFQGDKSPIEAEKIATGYSAAWMHHKGKNPHHWEYWCDYNGETGAVYAVKMPSKYVVEMVCDWIGAGQVYSNEKWTQAEPYEYYMKVRKGRHFHPDTEALVVALLTIIKDGGLEMFHDTCRRRHVLFGDYEKS